MDVALSSKMTCRGCSKRQQILEEVSPGGSASHAGVTSHTNLRTTARLFVRSKRGIKEGTVKLCKSRSKSQVQLTDRVNADSASGQWSGLKSRIFPRVRNAIPRSSAVPTVSAGSKCNRAFDEPCTLRRSRSVFLLPSSGVQHRRRTPVLSGKRSERCVARFANLHRVLSTFVIAVVRSLSPVCSLAR